MAVRRVSATWWPLLIAVLVGPALLGLVSFGPAGSGSRTAAPDPRGSPHTPAASAAASASNCTQGANVIEVPPSTPSLTNALLDDYNQLGAEGGGTIELGAGTFVLPSMLVFKGYSNVSVEGSGVGQTILSMPSDPVGRFTSNTGALLGRWNYTQDQVVDGSVVDFIRVDGPTPINNFEMCNLTLRGEANNATEDWDGSFLFDSSGGHHHVYENLALTGFYGPSTIPNGIHLESFSNSSRAYGYVLENVTATNNTLPFDYNPWVVGGPNFLNVGPIVNCTIENLTGIGLLAFELAPPIGCLVENVSVSGHLLIDPAIGGTWGNTTFQNLVIDSRNTAAPNAMGISIPNAQGDHGYSNFTDMRWNNCTFYGNVLNGKNMIDVENSSFFGGINETPAIFVHNYVNMTDWGPQYLNLPIQVEGVPLIGQSSNFSGNMFIFPNSTFRHDPFVLHVPQNTWRNDVIEIAGRSPGYLLNAANVSLDRTSVFSNISYVSLGNGSPARLTLVDLAGSQHFVDHGASVSDLYQINDDLPEFAPSTPTDLRALGANSTSVTVTWTNSSGNVTNYTVYAGTNATSLNLSYSAGLNTSLTAGNLTPASEYYFEVVAWNETFPSSPTGSIEFRTHPLPQYAPGTPTGLTIRSVGTSNVGLAWSGSSGNVTNYTLLVGFSPGDWSLRISVGLSLAANVTGLTPNVTYFFEVMGWNTTWASPASAPVNATTLSVASRSSGPGNSPPGFPAPGSIVPASDWALLEDLASIGVVLAVFGGIVGGLAAAGYSRARRRTSAKARRRR
jgi:hypothetical protein